MHRVLIVDDIPSNIKVLGELLRDQYEILVANNGEKAIKLALEKRPDLILLDVMMPGTDGLTVCRILKDHSETTEIPIIFITARNETEDIVKAFEAGGQDYITKPFNPEELYARVRAHLELKHSRQALKEYAAQLVERNCQLQDALEQLKYMAHFDILTNLPNRRYMLEKMREEAARTIRHQRPMAVIIADIDNFKAVNDMFGHDCGDYVLQTVAKVMRAVPRAEDTVARWGGEEFLLVLPETDLSGAGELAEKIRQRVETAVFDYFGKNILVTLTLGVAEFDREKGIEGTIKKADDALYKGKRMCKNCVVLADNLSVAEDCSI